MTPSRPAHLLRPAQRFTPKQAAAECLRLMREHGIELADLAEPEKPGVPVTRGRSYTHDPRYQVDPSKPFVGEFTLEWQRKRARGA
jgi:hypothetical protein